MSVLIAMAVYSTPENQKDDCLRKTLESLRATVDFTKHKLRLSVNGYTEYTLELLAAYNNIIDLTYFNGSNLGTAEAINKVWKERQPGQHCIKMDDDVVIHEAGWIEKMVEAINLDPNIGIVGLKRKDCIETPWHEDPYFRSELRMLPHTPGHPWVIVEKASHVMGTCQLYNSALLDKIGYLYQPKKYGWDDVLACSRSIASGFENVFIPQVNIDHIDPGNTPYQTWKEKHSWEDVQLINQMMAEYKSGARSTYYNPFQ